MCEMVGRFIKKHEEEKAANARYWKIPACCDDDDDYNFAITPNEPVDSLSMGDEHLNTILATELDEFIKSCVENLVPNPSESKGENGCDSLYDEDVLEKIFLNPLFEEEIIPMMIDHHHGNVESDLIESLLNHDSSIIPPSLKIDSLFDEFAGELTLLKSIPPGIDETDCDPEEEIHLIERLVYDNSSPRPPKEFVSENYNADIESFSPSPIPVEDSDSFMKEIDLSFTLDDSMSPGIEEDDYDSERDILILEELLDNYSLSLPENKSFHFDIPSFSRNFQRCMLAIFHDMVEKTMKVFMDDFSVFGNSFKNCLSRLDKMLQRCEDTNLSLNWEKSHFMVKEGIVLGHKISKNKIEVDRAKVIIIAKFPYPKTVKGVQSFLGHADFYQRFIQDFSKISRPMTHLLEKNTPFIFSKDCIKAFQTLKKTHTEAPILIAPNWDLSFELMCDASDFAIGAVLGQRHEKHFKPIDYASKIMNDAESNYTTTETEMLAVVYAFEKFRSYLIMNKSIVHTYHSALKYLFAKKDAKARFLRWVLLL
nr:reverse transcriptase domain-containing protein [Tanacetum cinerariifolium]